METIDFFKYKSLLAELENIKSFKSTKKPIQEFISKIYELSNKLNYYDNNYINQPETLRYSFMLTTRAMSYYTSKNNIKHSIIKDINFSSRYLITKKFITPEQVTETFEYYNEKVSLTPDSIKQLLEWIPYLEALGPDKVALTLYAINEFRIFSQTEKSIVIYFNKLLGPDNIISKCSNLTISESDKQKSLNQAKYLLDIYNTLLKDSDEHNCTSSEEHY